MASTATRAALPTQLQVVIGILFAGTAICLIKTVRNVMHYDIDAIVAIKALPLLQFVLAIGLLRRMGAARIASMLWFAFTTLSSVFVLLTLLGGQEPTFAKGSPAIVATMAVVIIAASIYSYFILTRPIVMATFAAVE